MQLNRDDIDAALTVLTWAGFAFATLWAVTGAIGYFHRRTYNLTYADAGRSAGPTPDFLNADSAKRRAAISRGQAFEAQLSAREAASPGGTGAASWWARTAALSTAVLTLGTAIVGTITGVDAIDAGVQQLSSMDSFIDIVNQHKVGALVALVIIAVHLVVFAKSSKKTLAGQ